jgi:fructan beta-fructosidase
MKISTSICMSIVLACFARGAASGAEDIPIADFEGEDYGAWKVTGEAFGPGPARGTLPNQMEVSGFEGKGLVNSYWKGDGTKGTLTSPPFRIDRKFINFLIGGGMHPGRTCMDLLVDGKAVRTATGPNDRPGGSERLDWQSWDVRDLSGKTAVLRIVDEETGGWGHINIDGISQSDSRKGLVETAKEIAIEADYLSFRLPAGAGPRTRASLQVNGKTVRETAGTGRAEAAWISWDVSALRGKRGKLVCIEQLAADGSCPLAASAVQVAEPRGGVIVVDKIYRETYRPQFHFTPRVNWTNDPNGLVYYKGEYHLFFQHNPTGINWGNMTWGHAVSPDLLHWTQMENAIEPDDLGTIFSGSAVVDWKNTSGFKTGDEAPIVCIYTSAGDQVQPKKPFTQSIAYSNDRGRTWKKYAKNPVLGHIAGSNRDPKVLWHEPSRKWVMALYLDGEAFVLYGSPDLKEWKKLYDVPMPGTGECPDFFELPVDGDPGKSKWVYWGANGNYRLGTFDGTAFKPETPPIRSLWGANDYAAQTYSDIPAGDGRRIQISWMNGGSYPGMPFNQQMSFPRVLTLRTTSEGARLIMMPVREIEGIRGRKHAWSDLAVEPGKEPFPPVEGELWDIEADLEPGAAGTIGLLVRGVQVAYDAKAKTVSSLGRSAPLDLDGGRIRLRVLVDRTSIEVFAGDGRVVLCSCFLPDLLDRRLGVFAERETGRIRSLAAHELRSTWR